MSNSVIVGVFAAIAFGLVSFMYVTETSALRTEKAELEQRVEQLEDSRIKMFRYFVYNEGEAPEHPGKPKRACPPDCTVPRGLFEDERYRCK